MPNNDIAYLDVVRITASTEKALCVDVEDMEESLWVPKSLIQNLEQCKFKVGDEKCTFELPEWWLKQAGIET